MKRLIQVAASSAAVLVLAACGASAPAGSSSPVGATASQEVVTDPDTYAGAVLYGDLSTKLGAIPKPAAGTQLGFVAKAFENEFWGAVKTGVETQVQKLNATGLDTKVDVRAAQGEADEQGQAALMSDMVNKKYSAIIAAPISDGNLVQSTEKAHASNIPVVNTIGGFSSAMDVFVGPRHYDSGQLAAKWIDQKLKGAGGDVAVIMGMPKESAARARTQGFKDYFEKTAPQFKVVESQNADWDRGKARDVMQTILQKHPNLAAVYANNDTMVMGALEAVKAAGKLGQVIVVGNDGTSEALKSIKAGELSATVNIYPDFAGRISVDIALRKLAGQDLPRVIYTTQAIIDPTNVDKSPEDVIGWKEPVFK